MIADLASKKGIAGKVMTDCLDYIKRERIQCSSGRESLTLKCLTKKISKNNAVIVKADKGNTVILIERTSYNKKIHDYLNSSGATKVKQSKFKFYIKLVRTTVYGAKKILPKEREREALLVPNPRIPRRASG